MIKFEKAFKLLMLAWTGFILILYSYNHSYLNIILLTIVLFFLPLTIIKSYIHLKKGDLSFFKNIKKNLLIKNEYNIKFKYLLFFCPIVLIILTNLFWLFFYIANNNSNSISFFLKPFFVIVFIIFIAALQFNKLKSVGTHLLNKRKKIALYALTFFLVTLGINFAFPENILSKNNFIFHEINIWKNIIVLFTFYFLFILLSYGTGRKIINFFKFHFESSLELFIFSIGVGLIPFMLGTFFISLLGILHPLVVLGFILLIALFSLNELKNIFKELSELKIKFIFKERFPTFKSLVFIGISFLILISFIIVTKPYPVESDSLHVYFNVPNLYTQYHEYVPIYFSVHSSMGQNSEMIYTMIMSILTPDFIMHLPLVYFVLSLIGFYALLKRVFNERHAVLGLLAIYFIPFNYFFIISNKTETLLSFYSLLIIYSLYIWYKNNFDAKFLYMLGALAGIAMGVKYNAAIIIVPLFFLAFAFAFLNKGKSLIIIKQIIVSVFLLFLFFSPWAIKNSIYFNNPIYPYEYLGLKNKNLNNLEVSDGYNHFEKTRTKEIIKLKHSLDNSNINISNFFITIWNQSVGKNTIPALAHNFGFIPLLVIPFYFLFYDKKTISLLVLPILYFIIWYALGIGGAWYALFGFLILYSLLPALLLKDKKLLHLYIPFIALVFLSSFTINSYSVSHLKGEKTKKEFALNQISHYRVAEYINSLNLSEDERIIIVGDFKVSFINKNNKLIKFIDPYFIQSGYLLNKGENNLSNFLKDNSINYIIHSRLYKNYYSWLYYKKSTLDDYILNYQSDIPSIYEDIDKFHKFLEHHTSEIYNDDLYMVYKLNK